MTNIVQRALNIEFDEIKISEIAAELDLSPLLVQLLWTRGLVDLQSIKDYLGLSNKLSYDPMLMPNMSLLCDRIKLAIEENQKVLLYSDYDCDGVCSAAIMFNFLVTLGVNLKVHIPSRYEHGYGLKIASLEQLVLVHKPHLIITTDCGINSFKEVDWVIEHGVDIIITDHHTPSPTLPNCIVVNPKISSSHYPDQTLQDSEYPDKNLCGSGIALKVVQALGGDPLQYIDLACVATIGDIVPLLDENRLIVKRGLQQINNNTLHNKGLKALIASLNLNTWSETDIAFKVVPRLNVLGRMGDAKLAFELLTISDATKISQIVEQVEAYNNTRKLLTSTQYTQALEQITTQKILKPFILLVSDEWKKGLTGILAAQLCTEFYRPVFVLALDKNGIYKATCRSIEGINIYDLIVGAKETLLEYGGHSQAAGLAIMGDRIAEFESLIADQLSDVDPEIFIKKTEYDLKLLPSDITTSFVQSLELLQPYGIANKEPVFSLNAGLVETITLKAVHTKLDVNGLKMIKFNDPNPLATTGNNTKQLVFNLKLKTFGNSKSVDANLIDVYNSDLYIDTEISQACSTLNSCVSVDTKPKYTEIELFDIPKLVQNTFGTLVIASNRHNYNIIKGFNIKKISTQSFVYCDINNTSKLVVAPILEQINLKFYDTIILDSVPYNIDTIAYINQHSEAQVYVCNLKYNAPKLDTDRAIFGEVFKAITQLNNEYNTNISKLKPNDNIPPISRDILHLSKTLTLKTGISIPQCILCYKVFEQLNIITTINIHPLNFKLNNTKSDLHNSSIYNFFDNLKKSENNEDCDE